MIRVTRFALILIAGTIVPGQFCQAGEDVPADTRYKYSQNDKVPERLVEHTKVVQTANTRKAPRRWKRDGIHWYFLRSADIPWAPNAPGD
jgi:hypothetical protein